VSGPPVKEDESGEGTMSLSEAWWMGLSEMRVIVTDWTGRLPGGVEGCAECGVPLEVVPGQRRVGAYRFHLCEPDLFCDDCVRRERPDLLEAPR
jgi:hypothetical protein